MCYFPGFTQVMAVGHCPLTSASSVSMKLLDELTNPWPWGQEKVDFSYHVRNVAWWDHISQKGMASRWVGRDSGLSKCECSQH